MYKCLIVVNIETLFTIQDTFFQIHEKVCAAVQASLNESLAGAYTPNELRTARRMYAAYLKVARLIRRSHDNDMLFVEETVLVRPWLAWFVAVLAEVDVVDVKEYVREGLVNVH